MVTIGFLFFFCGGKVFVRHATPLRSRWILLVAGFIWPIAAVVDLASALALFEAFREDFLQAAQRTCLRVLSGG
jgi:hypothetical protein